MKYAFKKARAIRIYDIANKKHKVTLNDLKNVQWTGGQETVYAEGTDGARLAAFDLKKVSNLKASNGAIDTGFISLQVGDEEKVIANGTGIKIREEIPVTVATKVTLAHKAAGTVGNEIMYIYKADVNGNPGRDYSQGATASATVFAYAPDTNDITLPTGAFAVGDVVIVDYYPTFSEYSVIANDTDKFAFTGEVIVDAWFTDLCTEKDVPLQILLPKGKISGTMDMTFGDAAAVQNVEIEALTKSCAGSSKTLWKLYNYSMEKIVDA